jgi:hypothetical protein
MYSVKRWIAFPFCSRPIARDPALRITKVGGRYRATRSSSAASR